ncbi:MAG: hypothetical protein KDK45_22350, partial [Leptospiraceae bacterium]|nr:hypothetical protein [Leptospiraceae bacterium]
MEYLLQKGAFPILRKGREPQPDSYSFTWEIKAEELKTQEIATGIIRKHARDSVEPNFTCKLCPGKLAGIRQFIHEGQKPILVLHYTGEHRVGKKPQAKKSKNLIFRTEEAEDLFSRLVQKVFSISYRQLHYQEYPACVFSPSGSTEKDWKHRIDSCNQYVKETLEKKKIRAVIMLGSPALFYFGNTLARENTDKMVRFNFSGLEIPGIVLRSPEAILHFEDKKKSLNPEREAEKYKEAREEERKIKLNIVEQLQRFQKEVGLNFVS